MSAPALLFTVRFDFVFFRFSTFPARWHILVMLMTAEPRGAGAALGTGCTCEGVSVGSTSVDQNTLTERRCENNASRESL